MYTRPYNEDAHGIVIPESYGGTLLRDTEPRTESKDETIAVSTEPQGKNPWEEGSQRPSEEVHKKEDEAQTFSFLSKLPFGSFLSDIGKNSKFSLLSLLFSFLFFS